MYKIIIKDIITGETLGEIDRFSELRYMTVLNREGDCSFKVSIKDEKLLSGLLATGQREVYIYREDQIVWGGILLQESLSITGGDDLVTFRCKGFMWYLRKMLIEGLAPYTNSDQIAIAWDLINSRQVGLANRNITSGLLPASTVRVSKQFENKTVYEALISLMELQNGFDAEITQAKVFNAYHNKKGTDRSATHVFHWGTNILRLDISEDFTDPINRAVVQGGGWGEGEVTETVENTSLQGSYGTYSDFVPYKGTEESDILQERGYREMTRRGTPRKQYSLYQIPNSSPDWTILSTGDRVRLFANYGYKSIFDSVRINSIEVNYNDGVEIPQFGFIYD